MVARYSLDDAVELPNFFQEWRESKNWTQQDLADKLKTTKQTVSRIETGARDWSKGYVEAFGEVIGCHPLAPLLSPPRAEFDVSNFLDALGMTRKMPDDVLAEAARSLRSLIRASEPKSDPVAKASPLQKRKESP